MSAEERAFWDGLLQLHRLRLAKAEVHVLFGEDVPQTILFANMGKAVIRNFHVFSEFEKHMIFLAIENGMRSCDTQLSTRIATGLLEALYVTAEAINIPWVEVVQCLGARSKKYLTDWGAWSVGKET
jgi:hypothetical protein